MSNLNVSHIDDLQSPDTFGKISVPFIGELNSKIYVIGEAPGVTEEIRREPFVGGAGQLLDKTLNNNGILRSECRIANVMKVRPPKNDFSHFYLPDGDPSPALVQGRKELLEDIAACKPNLILCLGNEPMKTLIGHGGIAKWRGSLMWHEELKVKVLLTYHPSGVLRQWDYFPLFSADLRKASEEMKTPDFKKTVRHIEVCPTFEKLLSFFDRLDKAEMVAFDIETDPLPEKQLVVVNCISFSDSPDWAISVPFTRNGCSEPYFSDMQVEAEVWNRVKKILGSNQKKVAQNAQYDMCVLKGIYGIEINNFFIDTMCAHHTLYPELPKGLDVLCSLYTDQAYYKFMRKTTSDLAHWTYNGLDSCITFEVAQKQLVELKDEGLESFYFDFINPLIMILTDMQIRGIKFDLMKRDSIAKLVESDISALQNKLNTLFGKEVNVKSTKQLQGILYGELGLPVKYKRGTRQPTTDEQALKELHLKHPSPVFDLILGLRELYTNYNTFVKIQDRKGRIHASFNIGGRIKADGETVSAPETGRISSSESIIYMCGANLQNQPRNNPAMPDRNVRDMYIPEEGCVFAGGDLSQAEARVVAYLAEEETMIKLFEEKCDLHKRNASWIYEVEEEQVTKDQRQFAKSHVHAFNYRESAFNFALMAGIPAAQAEKIRDHYFTQYPKILFWHIAIEQELAKRRCLITPFGRKRVFFGRWGKDLFKEATAYVPQSTVGDLENKGLVNVVQELTSKGMKSYPVLQGHDSSIFNVPVCEIEDFWKIYIKAFYIPITIHRRTFVIPIDLAMGNTWGLMKDVKKGVVYEE